jgi:nitric oxide reductase NorQ protein
MNELVEPYKIQKEPFYVPVNNEVGIFNAAYKERLPVLLKGPTGCGKTRFVEYQAYKLGLPLFTVSCHEDLTANDLVGRLVMKGGDAEFIEGPLTLAAKYGGIAYLDEIVEARKDAVVCIHPLTDHRRQLPLEKLRTVIEAHKDFLLVCSYNPGYQSIVKNLKVSTKQRFVGISFDYPSAKKELEILVGETELEREDVQSLVSVEYKGNIPKIKSILLSTEHEPGFSVKQLRKDVEETVILPIAGKLMSPDSKIFINPIGVFENAGPYAETGLSGRKIVVDAYGDSVPVGGGAFSGKDPFKCDRSAAYYARHVAKTIVGYELASSCTVKLAYSIGLSRPISINIEATDVKIPITDLENIIQKNFTFTPKAMINELKLLNVSYKEVAKYGHFGKNEWPWEEIRYLAL